MANRLKRLEERKILITMEQGIHDFVGTVRKWQNKYGYVRTKSQWRFVSDICSIDTTHMTAALGLYGHEAMTR
jgi:hypothetical protein